MHGCSCRQLFPHLSIRSLGDLSGDQDSAYVVNNAFSTKNKTKKNDDKIDRADVASTEKLVPYSNTLNCQDPQVIYSKKHICFHNMQEITNKRNIGRKLTSQVYIYANLPHYRSNVVASLFMYMIFASLFIGHGNCDTIKCPSGCLCVYGENNHQLMDTFLKDERQIRALITFKNDSELINTYFCSHSSTQTIPKGSTAVAQALFLDKNMIPSLKLSDFVPDSKDVTVTSPTVVLSLSNNQISSIEKNAFLPLEILKFLMLRNNSISDIDWMFSNLPQLKNLIELDLSSNNIRNLKSQEIGILTSLKKLDLSDNKIDSMDGSILSKFPNLEDLDLSSNRIKTHGLVPGDSTIFPLKHLSLSNNGINDVEYRLAEYLRPFSKLETLDLSKNRISSGVIPSESFPGLVSLKSLNLSRCSIKALGQGWLNGGPHESLETLDLSNNLLTSISMHAFSFVRTLDVNVSATVDEYGTIIYNAAAVSVITRVPTEKVDRDELGNLGLRVLFLNGNRRLFRIEDNAFDFVPNLRLLFLQNCAIHRLNIASTQRSVAKALPQLTYIWIYGNPILCDCNVRYLKTWNNSNVEGQTRRIDASSYILNKQTKYINVEISMCALPTILAGSSVAATSGNKMICPDEPYSILIAMLIGPVAFGGSVLLIMLCGSLHVLFAKMKKDAIEPYRTREEVTKTPKTRVRRRNVPSRIFSGFEWNRPAPQQESSGYSAGRTGRYTNIVLGHLGPKSEENPVRASATFLAAPAFAHSTTSLASGDIRSNRRETQTDGSLAVPLLVKEIRKRERVQGTQSIDTMLGAENVKTRGHSSDIPFITEKYQTSQTNPNAPKSQYLTHHTYPRDDESEYRSPLDQENRKSSLTTLSNSRKGSSNTTPSGSEKSHSSVHTIPRPSVNSFDSSEEICL